MIVFIPIHSPSLQAGAEDGHWQLLMQPKNEDKVNNFCLKCGLDKTVQRIILIKISKLWTLRSSFIFLIKSSETLWKNYLFLSGVCTLCLLTCLINVYLCLMCKLYISKVWHLRKLLPSQIIVSVLQCGACLGQWKSARQTENKHTYKID